MPDQDLTDFNNPDNLTGGAVGGVATLTIFGGDVIASQTNLVTAAVKAPFDLIPLSLEICNRARDAGTPSAGLYNSTDTADIFANATLGATGVPVHNSTVAGTAPAVVNKGDVMQLRATTAAGVTITGLQAVLTYLSTGDPSNR